MKYKCSGCGILIPSSDPNICEIAKDKECPKMKYKYKCICGRIQTYSAPCIEGDPMCLGCSRWPMELIKEEDQMSDCDIGRTIRAKVVDSLNRNGLNGEGFRVREYGYWAEAESYCKTMGKKQPVVFQEIISRVNLTAEEIDCLHRKLSAEAFAATGLKAPEKKFEPFLWVTREGYLHYAADASYAEHVQNGIVVTGSSLYAKSYGVLAMLKLFNVDMDDLANRKLRMLDEWAEDDNWTNTCRLRLKIAELLKEPSDKEGA